MVSIDIAEITKRLRELPEEKLVAVYEFVNPLAEDGEMSESFKSMLASEAVLRRDGIELKRMPLGRFVNSKGA